MTDIIVVGGGPAGMTAALYAQRNGKSALVIEKNGFGGQITHSPKVENYPGTLQMSGNEFADRMMDQILAQGASVEFEEVVRVEDLGNVKAVITREGSRYEGRAVIFATGVQHRMLGLEGEQELLGEGISFCAVCDGDFYSGQTVCVAGGGNSALQEAILLAEKCREVIILQDLPELTGEQKLQDILRARDNVRIVTETKLVSLVTEDGALRGVETESRKDGSREVIACDGLFVAIGLIPENDAFKNLADLDAQGYFDSDEACLTRTPGIYAAGDCRRKTVRQVVTAAADGAAAALAACRYINGLGGTEA